MAFTTGPFQYIWAKHRSAGSDIYSCSSDAKSVGSYATIIASSTDYAYSADGYDGCVRRRHLAWGSESNSGVSYEGAPSEGNSSESSSLNPLP